MKKLLIWCVLLASLASCGRTFKSSTYRTTVCKNSKCFESQLYYCEEVNPLFYNDGRLYIGTDSSEANRVCQDAWTKFKTK